MHLPNEAYQLAEKYELGEPIRVYRTMKRPQFKRFGWAMGITYLFFIIVVLTHTPSPFHFTQETIFAYSIAASIMFGVALLFLFHFY
ncbi:hypothetical protein KSZ_36000 [Dictyobacter formicarum]|uniref:Uncharacterized protein n=2 Tax=Dictyobacter formicarum TaxID=2778368 RepID=A0ABQ3VIS7_9CHLR|nr:hypothetical protein KSZ_36000 [Dictyobacter formicarum]